MVFGAREEHSFEVSVTIPTLDFYAVPVNPDFLEREQRMHWNLVRETLEPLTADFDVYSYTGYMAARLAQEPTLSNGKDNIDLKVVFNNFTLGLLSQVVNVKQGGPGSRVPMRIEAIVPPGGFRQGEYYGSVQIIFESLLPAEQSITSLPL
ncbi:adhesin [Pseudomonas sp. SIMBA_077]